MHLPGPFRAAVGLVATAATEARHLPDRAIELPMLAVSSALQASLRAQQRYARLAARGDEVLSRRKPTDEPPPWATFDEPVAVDELRRATRGQLDDLGRDPAANQILDEILGGTDPAATDPSRIEAHDGPAGTQLTEPIEDEPVEDAAKKAAPATTPPAKKATAKKAPVKKATATKATATKATAKKAPAKKAPAKKAVPATEASTTEATATGKTVHKPRHTTPSRFDDATDD